MGYLVKLVAEEIFSHISSAPLAMGEELKVEKTLGSSAKRCRHF